MAGDQKVSRPFVILAIVGAGLIVLLLGYKVLGGGGGGGSSDSAAPASTAATAAAGSPAASTTTTTSPAAPNTPNQSFDVFTTKNPFQPLVTDSSSGGSSGSTSGSDSSSTTSTTTASGDATPPPTVPTDQAPSAGTPVSVLEVFSSNGTVTARVQVGSTVYTVVAGQTFATSYKVVSLDPGTSCGQFQFGDSPFQLCAGQQTLK
jgi:hypothetical protein